MEEDSSIEELLALQADKTVKGKRVVAARVKAHCEAHDDVMEYQAATLAHRIPYLL